MPQALSLKRFPSIRGENSLQSLNRLVELNELLMPHQVASATGCTLDEAMKLLMFLASIDIVETFLLVYHLNEDTETISPVMMRPLNEGPPKLPFICNKCGQQITNQNELSYDFIFRFKHQDKVRFSW
jgi:hypothetical protein